MSWSPFQRETLPAKLAMGMQCFAWSFQVPYIPVYASASLGASLHEIGILGAAALLVTMIAAPSITQFAERNGLLIEVTGFVWTTATVGVGLIAKSTSFNALIVGTVVWSLGACVVIPLNDSAAMEFLVKRKIKHEYGYQRLWGAVMWGVGNAISGWIVDKYSFPMSSAVSAAMSLLAGVSAIWLRVESSKHIVAAKPSTESTSTGQLLDRSAHPKLESALAGKVDYANGERQAEKPFTPDKQPLSTESTAKNVLIGSFRSAKAFLCVVFICGSFMQTIQQYLFIWLGELGSSSQIMGLSLTFTCISEPFFFLASSKILTVLGVEAMLKLTMATYVLRCTAYGFLVEGKGSWVLPVELLHGITFGVFFSAMVHKTSELAPASMEAQAQGFVTSIFATGRLVGVLTAGMVYEQTGARTMFLAMALVMTIALMVYKAVLKFK